MWNCDISRNFLPDVVPLLLVSHSGLPLGLQRSPTLNSAVCRSPAGARPERLPCFDEECWQLMEACWNGDPSLRPLLGIVEPSLQSIMVRMCNCDSKQKSSSLEDSN